MCTVHAGSIHCLSKWTQNQYKLVQSVATAVPQDVFHMRDTKKSDSVSQGSYSEVNRVTGL